MAAGLEDRASRLAAQFAQAQPFRHIVVDDFLDAGFCQALIDAFPGFDEKVAVNEMGQVGRKAVVSNLAAIAPAYAQFDALLRGGRFLRFLEAVAGIPRLLYDPEYVGGGTHENLHGQDLDFHVDFNFHPTRGIHRRLNLILFLNPEWHAEWGGCLQLCRDPWQPEDGDTQTIVPLANRAVLFETTESSWHGFTRIALPAAKQHLSRRSIAVYFYTRERPPQETAPAHGTVYVPRHLPRHIEAGHTLDQSDVDSLHVLIERRNEQIRYLYERELEYSKAISAITHSLSFRVGRAMTWPLRKLLPRRNGSG